MTFSLEQFRERLVDYLYGDLTGDELAAFEACLAESDACRRELENMRDTLRHARASLADLEEAPPPHVRRAVFDFAAERAAGVSSARVLAAAPRGAAAQPKTA